MTKKLKVKKGNKKKEQEGRNEGRKEGRKKEMKEGRNEGRKEGKSKEELRETQKPGKTESTQEMKERKVMCT